MTTRILFLRAVNVGGATLPMARLRELATGLGATGVSTYIASGNLIANVPGRAASFDRALEKAVEAEFGFFREVISRTPSEVRRALEAHPFEIVDPRFSYVTFLAGVPTAAAVAKARGFATGGDVWEVVGSEMHVRYAQGAGKAAMKVETVARALGWRGRRGM